MVSLEPLLVIPRSLTFDLGNGKLGVHWPPGKSTVLSIQPDGSWETRPAVGGPYEIFTLVDDKLCIAPLGQSGGNSYAFLCPKFS